MGTAAYRRRELLYLLLIGTQKRMLSICILHSMENVRPNRIELTAASLWFFERPWPGWRAWIHRGNGARLDSLFPRLPPVELGAGS